MACCLANLASFRGNSGGHFGDMPVIHGFEGGRRVHTEADVYAKSNGRRASRERPWPSGAYTVRLIGCASGYGLFRLVSHPAHMTAVCLSFIGARAPFINKHADVPEVGADDATGSRAGGGAKFEIYRQYARCSPIPCFLRRSIVGRSFLPAATASIWIVIRQLPPAPSTGADEARIPSSHLTDPRVVGTLSLEDNIQQKQLGYRYSYPVPGESPQSTRSARTERRSSEEKASLRTTEKAQPRR